MRYETNSRKLISLLKAEGWFLVNTEGSHHQFEHPTTPGKITVPHPKKDLPLGLTRAIYRQAGLSKR
jgi:predicted RNA binding protein YcfA (HicA-like mRNA interferase family)